MAKTENKPQTGAKLEVKDPFAGKKAATPTPDKGKTVLPKPETTKQAKVVPYEPTELVIKEVMVQKNVTREEAISILKNPK